MSSSALRWTPRRAIILAAGTGQRLGPEHTGGKPKSLLEIGGQTLLAHQLKSLSAVGVERAAIVVGFNAASIERECEQLCHELGVEIELITNTDYARTNTVFSLYLARGLMDEGFYCLNGDVLFPTSVLQRLGESPHESALAVEQKLCGDEEVKALVDEGDRIISIGKGLSPRDSLGEFIGVARYGASAAESLAESLRHVVEDRGERETFFEHALHRITHATPLYAVRLDGEPVIEIDFPEDLARARDVVAPLIQMGDVTRVRRKRAPEAGAASLRWIAPPARGLGRLTRAEPGDLLHRLFGGDSPKSSAELWWDSSPLLLQRWLDRRHTGPEWTPMSDAFSCATTNPHLLMELMRAEPESWRRWRDGHGKATAWDLYRALGQGSAQAFLPRWHASQGERGWVSLQTRPSAAFDPERTLQDALELAELAPNVMVKIPGTASAYGVLEEVTARGIATNNTLTFSTAQFIAYLGAIERGRQRADLAGTERPWRSVFSLMTSRITTRGRMVDEARERGIELNHSDLRWAELAILRRLQGLLSGSVCGVKLLVCSLRVDDAPSDYARTSMHLEQTLGDDLVYTCPPSFLDALAARASDIGPPAERRESVPPAVLSKLLALPSFRQVYEPDGLSPREFDTLPQLVASRHDVLRAERALQTFVTHEITPHDLTDPRQS